MFSDSDSRIESRYEHAAFTDRDWLAYVWLMELRQLTYFARVADDLHFGRAAERLHVVPSAVSQQIGRLERELGVELFDRSHRAIRLTPAGAHFRELAEQVLDAQVRASDEMRKWKRAAATVRVGTTAGLGKRVNELVNKSTLSRPPLTLAMTYRPTSERLAAVAGGELDLAFVRGDSRASRPYDFTPVWDDELVVALPEAHSLAGRAVIMLGDLAGLPLSITDRRHNPDLHDTVYQAAARSGFVPTQGAEFAEMYESFAALAIGAPSWTVFLATHAETLTIPGIVFRPVLQGPNAEPLQITTYIVTDARRRLPELVSTFIQLCRE